MLNAGGLKLAAKRTAFGDVSNTVNVSRPSKDDSAIGGKGDFSTFEKTVPALQDKKTTSLLRPAQRPLSVLGLKPSINSITHSSSQPHVKHTLPESQPPPQPSDASSNTRKIPTKKSTAILNETASIQPALTAPDPHIPSTLVAPIAPIHRELQPRQQLKSLDGNHQLQPRPKSELDRDISERQPQEAPPKPQAIQNSSEEPTVLRSDGIYVDEQGRAQLYDYVDPIEIAEVVPVEEEVLSDVGLSKQIGRPSVDRYSEVLTCKSQPPPKSTLATVSEPEEYWDDEGEENYDEEGYVTARSFKSRGENTTGGATTVLFPKVNLKVRKEIATAKDLIERSKTAEELEDEAWDTTMVAEYGEEIFQYMRDLEVMSIEPVKSSSCLPLQIDQDASQRALHGQPGRDPMVNARCPDGLDCSSPPSLQPPTRNPFSLHQLH